jgi:hypothetical protein
MDSVAMILFGSVIATITGLNFMELHKIRKNLERRYSVPTVTLERQAATAAPDPELDPHGLRSSA